MRRRSPPLLLLAVAVLGSVAGCARDPIVPTGAPDLSVPDGGSRCTADRDCGGATPRCDVAGGGRCVACLPGGDDCKPGQVCQTSAAGYACVAGCRTNLDCPLVGGRRTSACCNQTCIDVTADPKNCGGCGVACTGAQTCCDGGCSYPKTDPLNCGGCGQACSASHAAGACRAGACALGTCQPGWGNCDGNDANGCETDLRADPVNCTACGMTCSARNGRAACANGCYVTSCEFGWDDCDSDVRNGCETSVVTDPKNCGGCRRPCGNQVPNGSAACMAGTCTIGACDPGYGNCDGDGGNGCESYLAGDDKNCAACGMACDVAAGLHCRSGTCQVAPPCGGYASLNGCWYVGMPGQTCNSVCMPHGGFDPAAARHLGNPICTHFFPNKTDGTDWETIECCSTDNNTNWGANGAPPDPNWSHAFCYVACPCDH